MFELPQNMLSKLGVALYEPIIGSLLASLRTEVVRTAMDLNAHTIFDCCCGAGGLLNIYSKHNFTNYIGLDKNPHMLNKCREIALNAHLVYGDACRLPFTAQSIDVSSICMALHTMPYEVALQAMQELCRVSKYCIVADYCLAERNIAIPSALLAHAVEALVGGEHYKCYKKFQNNGGLEGFFYKLGISPILRRSTLGGAGLIAVLKNPSA